MNFAEKRLRPNRQDRQQVLRISIKMAAVLVLFSSGKAAISIDSLSFSTESSEKHGIYFAIRSDPAQILRLILMFLREGDGCASDVGIVPRDYSGVSHGLLLTDCFSRIASHGLLVAALQVRGRDYGEEYCPCWCDFNKRIFISY